MRVGQIELVELIGRGTTGEVWRGLHEPSGRAVAVKILSDEMPASADERDLFHAEAAAIAALNHPSIVALHDYGTTPDPAAPRPYLVMDLVAGSSLAGRSGTLSWTEMKTVLLRVLDALAHAHAHGVVHLDLKPGNLFASEDLETLKLGDFGISLVLRRLAQAERDRLQGTPMYMAPEQIRRAWREYGPWTDLFALGCLGWSLACGAPPFADRRGVKEILAAQLAAPLPTFEPRIEIPDGYERWLRRLLERDATLRFQLAADATRALLELDLEEPLPAQMTDEAPTISIEAGPELTELLAQATPSRSRPLAPVPVRWESPDPVSRALAGLGLGLHGLRNPALVGRRTERQQLWAALRDCAATRHPQAVVVRGAAGVGKSGLARWLCERAHELGAATWLHAAVAPEHPPQAALRRMVDAGLVAEGLDGQGLLDHLHRRLPEWTGPGPKSLAEALRAEGEDDRLPGGVLALLHELTRERALVLWIDDGQWDASTLAFVQRVLEVEHSLPVTVVLTLLEPATSTRPEAAERLAAIEARPETRRLVVSPMSLKQTLAMVESLVGLEPTLARRVAERAQGRPLFALHLLDEWVANDRLTQSSVGLVLRDPVGTRLPTDVGEVTAARVDGLLDRAPEDLRWALGVASCLGREVEEAELAGALRDPDLARRLGDRLVRGGLAELLRSMPRRWRFAHRAVREAALARANADQEMDALHAACAVGLARLADPPAGRIGLHLAAGGTDSGSGHTLLKVAEAHAAAGRTHAALRLADLVAGVSAERPAERAKAALLRCRVARDHADPEALVTAVQGAVAAAAAAADDELRARSALASLELGRMLQDNRLVQRALHDARAHTGIRKGAPAARLALATARCALDSGADAEALEQLDHALLELDDKPTALRAEIHAERAAAFARRGHVAPARSALEAAMADFASAGERVGVARATLALGHLELGAGDDARARHCFERTSAQLSGADARTVRLNLAGAFAQVGAWTAWDEEMARLEALFDRPGAVGPPPRLELHAVELSTRGAGEVERTMRVRGLAQRWGAAHTTVGHGDPLR